MKSFPWPVLNERGDVDLTTSHTWTPEQRAAYAADEDAAWDWEGAGWGHTHLIVEEID